MSERERLLLDPNWRFHRGDIVLPPSINCWAKLVSGIRNASGGSALPDRLQSYRIERLKEMGCNAHRLRPVDPAWQSLGDTSEDGMIPDRMRKFQQEL